MFGMINTLLIVLVGAAFLWWAINADFKRFTRNRESGEHLDPESKFKVVLTDSEIVSQRPDGTIERLALAELKELYIVTTSSGPWTPDVWWLFVGSTANTGCSFPGGATGEQEVLRFAEKLPGFDSNTFISAMGSTNNAKFLCWRAA